ncbi:hypothetical protein BX659_14710 [Orenia metallireducens]|uniref:Uncharacterized protein n=1 Tax=Orenia metallireducens TaxID=1413210 RepID=A0A285IHF1_9FIRM|nr:hypothetical protein BX659_14710 [Orenia metallireducens]SNY47217.1 hypothetical protein SAMN06265827_14810 [Orenia metallireducens]
MKLIGKPDAGKPHVRFEEAGFGNLIWMRYCDTHRRKDEQTGKTNVILS